MFDKLFGLDKAKPAEEGTELLTTVYDNVQLSMVRSLLEAESIPYLFLSVIISQLYEVTTILAPAKGAKCPGGGAY